MLSTTSTEPVHDRRLGPRRPCHLPVRVHVRGPDWTDSFVLHSVDLSDKGLFLRTDWLYPRGEWLELELALEGRAEPVRGLGRVMRVAAGHGQGSHGIVVNLDRLDASDRQALLALLD